MDPTRNFDHEATAPNPARVEPAKRETSEHCRERAADDLEQSGAEITANQKIRLEASAASWTARAKMLKRVEDGVARRSAEAADAADAKAADGAGEEAVTN